MASGTVNSHPLKAPHWVFRWRPSKQPLFPKLFALTLVGGAFAFLIVSVRVRVDAPAKSTPHKASLIYLRDDAQGRALTLKASEGGPFPSRFDLSQWDGLVRLESAALAALRFQPPPYNPRMEDLPPENLIRPQELAAKGERFFPAHSGAAAEAPDSTRFQLAPVLYPLAGTTSLPTEVPPFGVAVDAAMAAASWRFLARLNAAGGVVECVSLEKGGEAGAAELEAWLHGVQFKPEPGTPFRWIALGIGFTNQPVDGTDAR
jgi:hypothetical protein